LFGGAAGPDGIHLKIIHELVNFIILLLVLIIETKFFTFRAWKKEKICLQKVEERKAVYWTSKICKQNEDTRKCTNK
jgi:hypothetical protein